MIALDSNYQETFKIVALTLILFFHEKHKTMIFMFYAKIKIEIFNPLMLKEGIVLNKYIYFS